MFICNRHNIPAVTSFDPPQRGSAGTHTSSLRAQVCPNLLFFAMPEYLQVIYEERRKPVRYWYESFWSGFFFASIFSIAFTADLHRSDLLGFTSCDVPVWLCLWLAGQKWYVGYCWQNVYMLLQEQVTANQAPFSITFTNSCWTCHKVKPFI